MLHMSITYQTRFYKDILWNSFTIFYTSTSSSTNFYCATACATNYCSSNICIMQIEWDSNQWLLCLVPRRCCTRFNLNFLLISKHSTSTSTSYSQSNCCFTSNYRTSYRPNFCRASNYYNCPCQRMFFNRVPIFRWKLLFVPRRPYRRWSRIMYFRATFLLSE